VGDVRVTFTKWRRRPHWEYDAVRLGSDEHGTWLGVPVGTVIARPGCELRTGEAQVVLVPHEGAHVATFFAPHGNAPCSVYVDITTSPVWDGQDVSAVDLDLDVIKSWDGRVWVDDEDEFAEHRRTLDYPEAVVHAALASADHVREAVAAGHAPFDGQVHERWLGALRAAMMMP
jgi:predicted RNA-binding protein associated with RNAse of E/G family